MASTVYLKANMVHARADKSEFAILKLLLVPRLSQADIVFWLGDLNYRITKTVPDEAVFDMVARDDLETLRLV